MAFRGYDPGQSDPGDFLARIRERMGAPRDAMMGDPGNPMMGTPSLPWWAMQPLVNPNPQGVNALTPFANQQQMPGMPGSGPPGRQAGPSGQQGVSAMRPLSESREQFTQGTHPGMQQLFGSVPNVANSFRSYQPVNNALGNLGAPTQKASGQAKRRVSGGTKKPKPSSSPSRGKLR